MSKIKNGGLDQYGAKPLEQQQFRIPGVERVKPRLRVKSNYFEIILKLFQCFTSRVTTSETKIELGLFQPPLSVHLLFSLILLVLCMGVGLK